MPPTMLALDTETTGLDLWHGCKPFLVSTCNDAGEIVFWEWDVNPFTREPIIPEADRLRISAMLYNVGTPSKPISGLPVKESRYTRKLKRQIERIKRIVLHNAKFDMRALEAIGVSIPEWDYVDDTLIGTHVLASAESHKLKDLALQYCDIPDDDQQELQEAVIAARRIGRKLGWRVAGPNDPHWPAMKSPPKSKESSDSWWASDMWLPRAVAKHEGYAVDHPWWTVCSKYAVGDAERTIALWPIVDEAIQEHKLTEQYETRRKLLGVTYRMESRGITAQRSNIEKTSAKYREGAKTSEAVAKNLAENKIDNLGSPKQLQGILFGHFKIRPVKATKTGFSTKAEDLEVMLDTVPRTSQAYHFIKNLVATRKQNKALEYLESYNLAGVPIPVKGFDCAPTSSPRNPPRPLGIAGDKGINYFRRKWGLPEKPENDWVCLHPNFNITGTDTTRFSSFNPNAQNISKKEGFNLRQVFGPLFGREWYSLDYSNIELRIFAYAAGDKRLIEAFEAGYSVHLIIAQELYPKEFAACERNGEDFKVKYKSTLYQWIKNGNFSLIYGAGEGKADTTYHLPGAYRRIRKQFPEIDRFMAAMNREAREYGYVTTRGGYRLQVPKDGPHKAVNYYVQGSAGWTMILAMLRVDEFLRTLEDRQLVMQIHDELVLDFPVHPSNLSIVKEVKRLMEMSGNDIGLPTPVDVDLIRNNWAEEEKVAA